MWRVSVVSEQRVKSEKGVSVVSGLRVESEKGVSVESECSECAASRVRRE